MGLLTGSERKNQPHGQGKLPPAEGLQRIPGRGHEKACPGLLFRPSAPIAIFAQRYGVTPSGDQVKHYYATESVGIATGVLITAIHNAGLVSLTHTPSPMNFLNTLLNRPPNERPFLLLVVGYPAEGAEVPEISKKPLEEIATFV